MYLACTQTRWGRRLFPPVARSKHEQTFSGFSGKNPARLQNFLKKSLLMLPDFFKMSIPAPPDISKKVRLASLRIPEKDRLRRSIRSPQYPYFHYIPVAKPMSHPYPAGIRNGRTHADCGIPFYSHPGSVASAGEIPLSSRSDSLHQPSMLRDLIS
jgi:hypothetical protein